MADFSALLAAIRADYRTRWLALGTLDVLGSPAPLPPLLSNNAIASPGGAHQVVDVLWQEWGNRGTASHPNELGRGIIQSTTFVPAGAGTALLDAATDAARGVLEALSVTGLRVLSPDPARYNSSGVWYAGSVDARFWWAAD